MHRLWIVSVVILLMVMLSATSNYVIADGGNENFIPVDTALQITVRAKSAVLMDTATGKVLFEHNSNEAVSVSHLGKLMTLLLTAEAIEKGELSFDAMLTASAGANSMGDPQIWLNAGEQISVDELIKAITIGNANDAAVVLAEAVGSTSDGFVLMMNQRAAELGMTNTAFTNPAGIDEDGQLSTAYDMALLSAELLKHEELCSYMTTWMLDVRKGSTNLVNSNRLVRTYKGITGLKAGSSVRAGSCIAASASRNNLSVVCVLLECESSDTRFEDSKALLDYAFSNYEMFIPEISGEELPPVSVIGGQSLSVGIKMQNAPGLVIPKGTSSGIETVITIEEKVNAPVLQGRELGCIAFYSGDKLITETKIVACDSVGKISVSFSFFKLLDYLLNF